MDARFLRSPSPGRSRVHRFFAGAAGTGCLAIGVAFAAPPDRPPTAAVERDLAPDPVMVPTTEPSPTIAAALDLDGPVAVLHEAPPSILRTTEHGRLQGGLGLVHRDGRDRIALILRAGAEETPFALPLPDLDAEDPAVLTAIGATSAAPLVAPALDELGRCLQLAARLANRTFGDCLREHLGPLDPLADLDPPCADWCRPPEPSYGLCGLCLWTLGVTEAEVEALREIARTCFLRAFDEHLRLMRFCQEGDRAPRVDPSVGLPVGAHDPSPAPG